MAASALSASKALRGAPVQGRRTGSLRPTRAPLEPGSTEAAQKLGGGSTKNGRDSISKRLGVKIYGEQPCEKGNIIVRQRGAELKAAQFKAGQGTKMGKDFTIYAVTDGLVRFQTNPKVKRVHVVEATTPRTSARRERKRQQFPPRSERRASGSGSGSGSSQ